MIYISSCFSKEKKIIDLVKIAEKKNIKYLEITSGTDYYPNFLIDLKKIHSNRNIELRFHNYFPPPKEHFFLNLSSPNKKIREKSITQIKKLISISKKFNSNKVGVHAGFLFDYNPTKKIFLSKNLTNIDLAKELFVDSLTILNKFSNINKVKLYVENNVLSEKHFKFFKKIPLLLLNFNDYLELNKLESFKLLLDIGHLKVTSKTLCFNYKTNFLNMSSVTDYFHLSENNGINDLNMGIEKNSLSYKIIKNNINIFKNKDFTIEVNNLISAMKSHDLILSLLNNNEVA